MGASRMRFSCDGGKCYLTDKVPNLGEFDDCFPGKIGFGDVDGLIERRGSFLVVEWKEPDAPLTTGQLITFKHLSTVPTITVLVVEGDNSRMTVNSVSQVTESGLSDKRPIDLAGLKLLFTQWYEFADAGKAVPLLRTGA